MIEMKNDFTKNGIKADCDSSRYVEHETAVALDCLCRAMADKLGKSPQDVYKTVTTIASGLIRSEAE